MKMGDKIAAARQNKGFTQEYVAQALDVSRQAVSRWETGRSRPDTKNLIALAQLLDVRVEHFTESTGEENAPPSPARSLRWMGFGMAAISLALYLSGLLSGVYNRMVMIPVSDRLEFGIPFAYYGSSDEAMLLMVFQIMATVFAALCLVIAWAIGKKK